MKFEVEREYEDSEDVKERPKGTKKKMPGDLRRKVLQHVYKSWFFVVGPSSLLLPP